MLHEAENWPLALKDLNIFEARYFEATAKGFCFCNFVAASIMRGFKMSRAATVYRDIPSSSPVPAPGVYIHLKSEEPQKASFYLLSVPLPSLWE